MMHTKNENVKNWKNDTDKRLYEEDLCKLCKWRGRVDRVDELINLLESFVGNKEFEKFFNHCEYSDEDPFDFDEKDIPILKGALDAMNIFDHFPLFFPSITHHLVVAGSVAALIGVIQLSFVHYNNRLLTNEEDKVIITSDIFYYLTFFVEDYDNPDNEHVEYGYEFYKDFFKRARKTYWENNDVKKFAGDVRNLRTTIIGMYNVTFDVHNMVYVAAIYLMVCNAFKNGRESVNYDDVVVGYLTVYKMIFNDIRPLVYSLYDEEKWGEVDKNISVYKPLDKSPFENLREV